MRVKSKIPFAVRNLALATALAAAWTYADATLVADGKLGDSAAASAHGTCAAAVAGEGYSTCWTISFVDDKKVVHDGSLYFGTDGSGNQFLYFLLPTDYVDNTYGTNSSSGWGGPGGHTFGNLLGSDSMGANPNFQWTDQNDPAHNAFPQQNAARIDYIADCFSNTKVGTVTDTANCGTGNTSGFKSAGVGQGAAGQNVVAGANGAGANWGNIDASITGNAGSILEIATSLEYDLKNIDPTATTNSSLNANWIKEVGYEIEFKPGTFDPTQFGTAGSVQLVGGQVSIPGLLILGDPHVSPPMAGKFVSFKPPCMVGDTSCVPEPSTPWLLGAGLAGALWYSRRRKELPVPGASKLLTPS